MLLAALVFAGTALLAAPAVLVSVGDRVPDPGVVSVTRAGAGVVLGVFAPRIATLVMFSTAGLGRATGALPGWLVWLTYALGAAAFVNVTIGSPSVYAITTWIGLVSVVLLVRHPERGFDLGTETEVAAG